MSTPIIINEELCTGCEICVDICPRDCFTLVNEKSHYEIKNCNSCGHCISACPEKALSHSEFPDDDYQEISDFLKPETLDGDQLYYLLKSLRSVKKFQKGKTIDKQITERLVDLTRYAASGHNAQNVRITIVENPEFIQQLKDEGAVAAKKILRMGSNPFFRFIMSLIGKRSTIRKFDETKPRFTRMLKGFSEGRDHLFHNAPTIAIFHAPKKGNVPLENCIIASDHFRTAAYGYGLGTCHIGYLVYYARYNTQIPKMLKIPKGNKIFLVLGVGYPKHKFRRFVGRKKHEVVWF